MRFFDGTSLPALSRAMHLASWRQKTYASNVANAAQDGWVRRDVRFTEVAAQAGPRLAATQPGHAVQPVTAEPALRLESDAPASPGIDLDREMVALASNQMRFELAARAAALRIAGLRSAISGRR
jgi:flagellar basal-body rod protein FlgB